ncbi:unnamed protein product [Amaranthus hypochondriacus]
METQNQLMKFKFHIMIGVVLFASLITIISVPPSLLNILAYFWPLLASTALFLVVVVVFSRVSPPPADVSGDKTAQGFLDYVAGQAIISHQ